MILHKGSLFQIYFGDARDALFPDFYLNLPENARLLAIEPFRALKKLMRLKELLFAHQVHGFDGIAVTSIRQASSMRPFCQDGDYLITNVPLLGIGIMAADCLPIIFYDHFHQAIAIVHAGWRGSLAGIAVKAFEHMQKLFKTEPSAVRVFFGPSAKVCCYRVGNDFLQHLEGFALHDQVLQRHGDELFFDLPLFNKLQLEEAGLKKEAFHLDYNVCTIDDEAFCSSRRQQGAVGKQKIRQMTVACLT